MERQVFPLVWVAIAIASLDYGSYKILLKPHLQIKSFSVRLETRPWVKHLTLWVSVNWLFNPLVYRPRLDPISSCFGLVKSHKPGITNKQAQTPTELTVNA